MKKILLLTLAAIANTLFRYAPFCFQFGAPEYNRTSYAVGQAVSYILLLLCISKESIPDKFKKIYNIVLWVSIANLSDELFFNPLELGWYEIIATIIIILIETFSNHINKFFKQLINHEQCTG